MGASRLRDLAGAGDPRPSALVLAAGASSRFPGTKQLAQLGGTTMLGRALDAVPPGEVRETVVVVGYDARAVARAAGRRGGLATVKNPGYRTGIASSIRAGMRALSNDSPGVLILLADQPHVTRRLVRRVLRAFEAGGGRGIAAAASGGVTAPPALFSRKYFPELESLSGDRGAKAVIERHPEALSLVRVRWTRALSDVDTPDDLLKARRLLEP